jgi:hypothetical protein
MTMRIHFAKLIFLFVAVGAPIDATPPRASVPAAAAPVRARRARPADSCVELPAAPVVAVPSCSGGAAVAP